MRALLIATAVVFASAGTLSAEPLVPQRVAADAKWVVHVDFDALRSAHIVEKLSQQWLSRDSTRQQLEKVREILGTDPLTSVHGVTFYGKDYSQGGYVVLLEAKVDRQRLLQFVRRMPDYQTHSYGDHELHTWTQSQGRRQKHSVTGCFAAEALTIVGQDAAAVQGALDVLEGKSPGLPADSPLAAEVPAGTAFWAAALGLAEANLPFRSPLVRKRARSSSRGRSWPAPRKWPSSCRRSSRVSGPRPRCTSVTMNKRPRPSNASRSPSRTRKSTSSGGCRARTCLG
jgi:hypothetical protein